MKIKTWMQLIVFVSMAIASGIVLAIFFQKIQFNKSLEKNRLADEIIKVVNQREVIANDYVNYHQDEAIIQWQVMYEVTVRLMQSNMFNTAEEQDIVGDMREENVAVNQIFTELILLEQEKLLGKKKSAVILDSEKKLKSQLFDKGETISIGAYRLAQISQQNSNMFRKRANVYALASIGILVSLIFYILILLRIKVIGPLEALDDGIRTIAAGNLDYIVRHNKKDEMGVIIRSFNEMAVKLKERTTERELISQQLKNSNEQLQQFAYIASHDLQEPLRTISSYLQLIERRYKGKLDQDADEFIAFAVNGANKLQAMISDLLLFSRVQTQGKLFLPTNMEYMLKQAEDHLQIVINENKVIITHDPLPTIIADNVQMITLFQNLLSNAIKFHAEEPPVIHISAQHHTHEWQFSIRDNGIGIDPQYKENLFVIFKRLVGKEYPGTGIGLAVCKRIVERHRGHIWVESELGKGSTFFFTIPKSLSEEPT